jgi:hypothetical protein
MEQYPYQHSKSKTHSSDSKKEFLIVSIGNVPSKYLRFLMDRDRLENFALQIFEVAFLGVCEDIFGDRKS